MDAESIYLILALDLREYFLNFYEYIIKHWYVCIFIAQLYQFFCIFKTFHK